MCSDVFKYKSRINVKEEKFSFMVCCNASKIRFPLYLYIHYTLYTATIASSGILQNDIILL